VVIAPACVKFTLLMNHSTMRPPVEVGQVLAGKFRIERMIGEGGMGVVAEATHLGLDERVALKFLRREVMQMPDVVARFDREARAAVKLKSEHVARISDVGKTDDGIPFMVMELLAGKDLAQMLTEGGPLPIAEAVEYVIQACEGLGEAHARGIVHRDIKPENLFVVHRPEMWNLVKVLDFGISKAVLVGPSSVNMASSNTSSIMGSPYYMSPEQLRSTRTVDHRADIWSLGVVLFELLTGKTIFDETHQFTELVAEILEAPHRKLCTLRPDAPIALQIVVDRCLEKDRAKRFQNVAELAVALLPFAPRRARITAERTTSITRAAGLITDPSFQMPPSVYPPPAPSSDSYPGSSSGSLSSPIIPADVNPLGETLNPMSETLMPPRVPTPLNLRDPIHDPSSLAAGAIDSPPARKQVSLAALALGAILLLGVGVGLAYGVIRTLRPAPIALATQPLPTTPTVAMTTTATASDTATATVTATATATVTATATAHNTHVVTRPSATASATTRPSLDIQLQR
jgi:serine/threonine protein kinase